MPDLVRRLLRFSVIASAVAYFVFFAADRTMSAFAEDSQRVVIRDVVSPGVHSLSGMLMLPSLCDLLEIETEVLDASRYNLVFTTWREPYRDCTNEEMPRHFKQTVFAPSAGIRFIAELDGKPLEISVLTETE